MAEGVLSAISGSKLPLPILWLPNKDQNHPSRLLRFQFEWKVQVQRSKVQTEFLVPNRKFPFSGVRLKFPKKCRQITPVPTDNTVVPFQISVLGWRFLLCWRRTNWRSAANSDWCAEAGCHQNKGPQRWGFLVFFWWSKGRLQAPCWAPKVGKAQARCLPARKRWADYFQFNHPEVLRNVFIWSGGATAVQEVYWTARAASEVSYPCPFSILRQEPQIIMYPIVHNRIVCSSQVVVDGIGVTMVSIVVIFHELDQFLPRHAPVMKKTGTLLFVDLAEGLKLDKDNSDAARAVQWTSWTAVAPQYKIK